MEMEDGGWRIEMRGERWKTKGGGWRMEMGDGRWEMEEEIITEIERPQLLFTSRQ